MCTTKNQSTGPSAFGIDYIKVWKRYYLFWCWQVSAGWIVFFTNLQFTECPDRDLLCSVCW